jgi:hypothetical protein
LVIPVFEISHSLRPSQYLPLFSPKPLTKCRFRPSYFAATSSHEFTLSLLLPFPELSNSGSPPAKPEDYLLDLREDIKK